jgi:hypothetical protein
MWPGEAQSLTVEGVVGWKSLAVPSCTKTIDHLYNLDFTFIFSDDHLYNLDFTFIFSDDHLYNLDFTFNFF